VPLSEDEQRILQEMEQKLYEHDRSFAERVRGRPARSGHPVRSAIAMFVAGFVLVLATFRSSLALASFGVLVMLLAALLVERGMRLGARAHEPGQLPSPRAHPDFAHFGRRLRARFRAR